MTLLEAIEARHSVRKYKDEPIPEEILTILRDRIREINEVSNASEETPEWFNKGVEAAILAPTAVNQQKFHLEYLGPRDKGEVPKVAAKPLFSMIGYSKIDLGIVKYHFEVGAGKENFEWA